MTITHVEILSNNLIETEQFYTNILGLSPIKKNHLLLSYQIGTSTLTFHKCEGNPIYHFAFTIPKNQLNEAERWLTSKLQPITSDNTTVIDFKNWNAKSIYFLDNNGNVLELIARYDLDNESSADFDFSRTTISEIAFVTDDVELLANKINSTYTQAYFAKQPPSRDFSVIGDDNGLIIIVSEGRNWFPTQIKAGKFWIKLEIENKGKLSVIELM